MFTSWRLWLALPPLLVLVLLRGRRNPDLVLRAPGISRARWTLLVAGPGRVVRVQRRDRVRGAGADTPPRRHADQLAPTGRDHCAGRDVPRGARRRQHRHPRRGCSCGHGARGHRRVDGGRLEPRGRVARDPQLVPERRLVRVRPRPSARYPLDPFGFMLGVLTAAAIMTTPIALIVHGSLRLSPAASGYAAATMVVGTSAHVLMVWAHRFVPASVSAPFLLAHRRWSRSRPGSASESRPAWSGSSAAASCRRTLRHGARPGRHPSRGRNTRPVPARLTDCPNAAEDAGSPHRRRGSPRAPAVGLGPRCRGRIRRPGADRAEAVTGWLVLEAFARAAARERLGEFAEVVDVALEVGEEQVGQITQEPVANDDAQRRKIRAVVGECVRGNEQPRSRRRSEMSNTVYGRLSSLSATANTGSSLPSVMSLNGPIAPIASAISARRRATSAGRAGSRRTRGVRSCSTAPRPGCRGAANSVRTSACCRRDS